MRRLMMATVKKGITMKTKSVKTGFETTFHRDGSVTVWDVYAQEWRRTRRPDDEVLATLETDDRAKVMRHCGMACA